MGQAALTIGITIRLPGEIHERLVDRRRETRVPTTAYIEQAIREKLEREQTAKPKQRRRAAG